MWRQAVIADDTIIKEKIPPLRTRGIFDPPSWGGHRSLVVGVFNCGPTTNGSNLHCASLHFDFSPTGL